MTTFPAYATDFECFPGDSETHQHLAPLFQQLGRVDFKLEVANPNVNQGQMTSDFDSRLLEAFLAAGAEDANLPLPPEIPQELDFSFRFGGKSVAVEIEKANREKILRDLLKSHMYLHCGADFALIVLPRNYPHSHGIWDLFDFGCARLSECRQYGFGTEQGLSRIGLVGYTQFCGTTNEPLSRATRLRMRKLAIGG